MTTLTVRANLPPLPKRIAKLPIDERGYPVPFFVAWVDGKAEFRAMDARKLAAAVRERRCWICGDILGAHLAFVIGPMCAVNRIASEPPSHRECALFAVQACPFMTMPKMRRRENDLPEDGIKDEAHLDRNPGVMLIWMTRKYDWFGRPNGGVLFEIGDPEELLWFSEGRRATRPEILKSINDGLPSLEEMARAEGAEAIRELNKRIGTAMELIGNPIGR